MIRHHSRRRILLSSTAGTALALLGRQSCAFAEDFYQRWPLVQPSDVLPFIRASAKQGDAEAVVTALDVWASKYPNYGLGAEKGAILEQLFVTHAPKVALEVGSFMGYSAVRTARRLPPQGILHCIEASAANAAVVWQVVDYAGVADTVDGFGLFLGLAQSRQQHRSENRNDGDDHQQFNERECRSPCASGKMFPFPGWRGW